MTAEQPAAASLNVPRGVSRKQRELYLSLTDEQKATYRRHFYECGRPAVLCYRFSIEEA